MNILHSLILGDQGEDILILHGFLGMGDNWKTYAKRLIPHGFRVHLIDQRNHGRSFWDSNFSYSILAQDIIEYCSYHNLKNILVLGHSMGGKVAMHLACYHYQLLKGFIVADIAPKKYNPHHQQILNGLSNLDFDKIPSRSIADENLSNWVVDASTRQFLLKNLYWKKPGKLDLRINIEILKNASEAIGEGLKNDAKSDKKCLFLKGQHSDYITDNDHSIIKYHFPNADQSLIKKSGHWLHAENPEDFFRVTLDWLKKTSFL